MAFRGEDITEDEIKKLEPILGDEGFTVENMKSKSAAAANLCTWVISIHTYNRIYVKVIPVYSCYNQWVLLAIDECLDS